MGNVPSLSEEDYGATDVEDEKEDKEQHLKLPPNTIVRVKSSSKSSLDKKITQASSSDGDPVHAGDDVELNTGTSGATYDNPMAPTDEEDLSSVASGSTYARPIAIYDDDEATAMTDMAHDGDDEATILEKRLGRRARYIDGSTKSLSDDDESIGILEEDSSNKPGGVSNANKAEQLLLLLLQQHEDSDNSDKENGAKETTKDVPHEKEAFGEATKTMQPVVKAADVSALISNAIVLNPNQVQDDNKIIGQSFTLDTHSTRESKVLVVVPGVDGASSSAVEVEVALVKKQATVESKVHAVVPVDSMEHAANDEKKKIPKAEVKIEKRKGSNVDEQAVRSDDESSVSTMNTHSTVGSKGHDAAEGKEAKMNSPQKEDDESFSTLNTHSTAGSKVHVVVKGTDAKRNRSKLIVIASDVETSPQHRMMGFVSLPVAAKKDVMYSISDHSKASTSEKKERPRPTKRKKKKKPIVVVASDVETSPQHRLGFFPRALASKTDVFHTIPVYHPQFSSGQLDQESRRSRVAKSNVPIVKAKDYEGTSGHPSEEAGVKPETGTCGFAKKTTVKIDKQQDFQGSSCQSRQAAAAKPESGAGRVASAKILVVEGKDTVTAKLRTEAQEQPQTKREGEKSSALRNEVTKVVGEDNADRSEAVTQSALLKVDNARKEEALLPMGETDSFGKNVEKQESGASRGASSKIIVVAGKDTVTPKQRIEAKEQNPRIKRGGEKPRLLRNEEAKAVGEDSTNRSEAAAQSTPVEIDKISLKEKVLPIRETGKTVFQIQDQESPDPAPSKPMSVADLLAQVRDARPPSVSTRSNPKVEKQRKQEKEANLCGVSVDENKSESVAFPPTNNLKSGQTERQKNLEPGGVPAASIRKAPASDPTGKQKKQKKGAASTDRKSTDSGKAKKRTKQKSNACSAASSSGTEKKGRKEAAAAAQNSNETSIVEDSEERTVVNSPVVEAPGTAEEKKGDKEIPLTGPPSEEIKAPPVPPLCDHIEVEAPSVSPYYYHVEAKATSAPPLIDHIEVKAPSVSTLVDHYELSATTPFLQNYVSKAEQREPTATELAHTDSGNLNVLASEDFEGIDIGFVEQYEATFDSFLEQHPEFNKHPKLVETMRVFKLQKMFAVTAEVESELEDYVRSLKCRKQEMTSYYQNKLLEANKRKATREIQLKEELESAVQNSRVLEGKQFWRLMAKNEARVKKQAKQQRQLLFSSATGDDPLALLPENLGPHSQEIRHAVQAPLSCYVSEKELKDLTHFQVDNAFLGADVSILEKKKGYLETTAKKHAWVDSVFRRLDLKQRKILKSRHEEKMGLQL